MQEILAIIAIGIAGMIVPGIYIGVIAAVAVTVYRFLMGKH